MKSLKAAITIWRKNLLEKYFLLMKILTGIYGETAE